MALFGKHTRQLGTYKTFYLSQNIYLLNSLMAIDALKCLQYPPQTNGYNSNTSIKKQQAAQAHTSIML